MTLFRVSTVGGTLVPRPAYSNGASWWQWVETFLTFADST